jgi:transcriptional regulator with XRE-family HTH domain
MSTKNIDPRLAAILGTPQSAVDLKHIPPHLLEETSPAAIKQELREALANIGVGNLLQRARLGRGLSVRETARILERSPSRIVAIERANTEINVATIVSLAQALGYRLELNLVPINGEGEPLNAVIESFDQSQPDQPVTEPSESAPLLKGSILLPVRRQKLKQHA